MKIWLYTCSTFIESSVDFHRLPSPIYDKDNRQKWIESIERYQPFNESVFKFVCRKHFQEDLFKANTKRVELIPGAVPTIFDTEYECIEYLDVPETEDQAEDIGSEYLVVKINELQTELLQADAEKQAMQRTLDRLTAKCLENSAKIAELRKKCHEDEVEKKKLINKISKIQKNVMF